DYWFICFIAFPLTALHDPLLLSHVFAVSRPDEFSICVGTEPIDAEDARALGYRAAQLEPMVEVIAHVVTDKWDHCHGIAPHHPYFYSRGSCGLRTHRCAHIHARVPVNCLGDKRHGVRTPSSENDARYRNALRLFQFGVEDRTLR